MHRAAAPFRARPNAFSSERPWSVPAKRRALVVLVFETAAIPKRARERREKRSEEERRGEERRGKRALNKVREGLAARRGRRGFVPRLRNRRAVYAKFPVPVAVPALSICGPL